jgi:hypothetical protein
MLTRAQVLERFGLPDSPAFELTPVHDATNVLKIRVSCEGKADTDMTRAGLSRLAIEIRSVDPDLAAKCHACLEKARARS